MRVPLTETRLLLAHYHIRFEIVACLNVFPGTRVADFLSHNQVREAFDLGFATWGQRLQLE